MLFRSSDKWGHPLWLCKCDCGNYKIYRGDKVKNGIIKSCGYCNNYQHHRLCNTRLYKVFDGMKDRCYNKLRAKYKYYGARGIKICDEWLTDFIAFYVWSMENGYRDDLTIDRIDVNSDYSPDNCRWVDHKTQQKGYTDKECLFGRDNCHVTKSN